MSAVYVLLLTYVLGACPNRSVLHTCPDFVWCSGLNTQMSSTQYELPDGKTIDVGPERYKTCELMFNPSLLEVIRCLVYMYMCVCVYIYIHICVMVMSVRTCVYTYTCVCVAKSVSSQEPRYLFVVCVRVCFCDNARLLQHRNN